MKFLLFFLIFSFFCKAQFQNVSVFAGVNSTSINLSVDSKVSRGTGILAGIRYFNWDESTWSFTVAFDQKAYSTTTILNKAITLDVTVNYLNLSPQFRLIKDGQFVFFVGAGLGIVLSGTSVLNSNGSSSSYSNKEFWKPVRASLITGISYSFSNFSMELSYDYSLTAPSKEDFIDSSSKFKSIQAVLSYSLF